MTRLLLLLLVFALSPAVAMSCIMSVAQEPTDIRFAELVVKGKLVQYEKVGDGKKRPLEHYGFIRVQTLEVLKGEERPEWEFYWWNSTFGTPEVWPYGESFLIAGASADARQPPLRGPSATVRGSVRPDLMQVVQAPCSAPFIFPLELTKNELRWIERAEQSLEDSKKLVEKLRSERDATDRELVRYEDHVRRLELQLEKARNRPERTLNEVRNILENEKQ